MIKNKNILFLLRFAVVIFLYFLIMRRVDWAQLVQLLTPEISPFFLLSSVLITIQAFFCSWRWRYIAQSHLENVPSLFFTFEVYLENLFFNQFLPATLGGDVLRVIRWQGVGVSGAVAASTVFLDRLSGLNGAAIISLLLIPLVISDRNQLLTALTALSLSSLVFVVTFGLFFIMRWPQIIYPSKKYKKIWEVFNKVKVNITFDRHYLFASILSIMGHLLGGLATVALARGFHIEVNLFFLIVLSSLITLISTIPITISGWGLREATFVTILSPLGIDYHQAFLVGLFVGLSALVSALPGGVITMAGLTRVDSHKSDG